MPHGWLPQPRGLLHVITVMYFMVFNTTSHPLSFCATNTEHTKPRVLAHTTKMGYTKPHAHFFAQGALNAPNHVSTFNQSPVTLLHKRISRYLIWTSMPPFKYSSSRNILPFCNCTSSSSLLQYPR